MLLFFIRIMNYFKNIEMFSEISETEQENLSDFCQMQVLDSWDLLFQQWDEPQALYIVDSWKLSVVKNEKEIAELSEWNLVWEMAFFWNPPLRSATVIAKEQTTLIVILQFSVEALLKKYPKLYESVKQIIEERTLDNSSSYKDI